MVGPLHLVRLEPGRGHVGDLRQRGRVPNVEHFDAVDAVEVLEEGNLIPLPGMHVADRDAVRLTPPR